jgi:hypothetical protein
MAKKIDPLKTETIQLRVPLTLGEVTINTLNFRPPKVKDSLRTDKYENGTMAAAVALMSSLTGQPESLLGEMVPEDFADCAVILARTNMRFMGQINLFKEQEDPTMAEETPQNTAPENSSMTSEE